MRHIIIKMILLGVLLFIIKSPALGQNTYIKCEVRGFDSNLSQADPGYFINFGSFSVFAEGKEDKKKEDAVIITKYYKLPQAKLILSIVGGIHITEGETSDDTFNNTLMMSMILGKKKIAPSPGFDIEENWTNDAVSVASAIFPIKAFDEGGEGALSTIFLGKKKPVQIMMTCKKIGK